MIRRRSEGTAKGETLRRYTQDPFPRGSYNLNVPLFRAATLSLRRNLSKKKNVRHPRNAPLRIGGFHVVEKKRCGRQTFGNGSLEGRKGGDGQWRTVDRFWGGKEGRENDRFRINDHSLQEPISRRLYLERGNGN